MTQQALLDQLEADLRKVLEQVRADLLNIDEATLHRRSADPKSWTIAECFAHLNSVYQDYLAPIELAIHKAKARKWYTGTDVRYNWTGSSAVRKADPGNRKRYRARKRYNFLDKTIPGSEIKSFIINSEMLLRLIKSARETDINRPRVRFAPAPLFKFRLGNLLEYLVLHAQRHVAQAKSRQ
jgi:DinB superfamily